MKKHGEVDESPGMFWNPSDPGAKQRRRRRQQPLSARSRGVLGAGGGGLHRRCRGLVGTLAWRPLLCTPFFSLPFLLLSFLFLSFLLLSFPFLPFPPLPFFFPFHFFPLTGISPSQGDFLQSGGGPPSHWQGDVPQVIGRLMSPKSR